MKAKLKKVDIKWLECSKCKSDDLVILGTYVESDNHPKYSFSQEIKCESCGHEFEAFYEAKLVYISTEGKSIKI